MSSRIEGRAVVRGPIHGDFHLANVLVGTDGRVCLIDLDQLSIGDPLVDAARFLSALRISALRVGGDHRALAAAEAGFAETYLSATGEDVRRLRLYESAFLVQSATTPFRLQWPGWEEAAEALLQEAEQTHATSTREARRAADAPRQLRSPRRAIDWSHDGRYLTALLHPSVVQRFGADLVDCRVCEAATHGSHQRFGLRLNGWRDGEKWSCAADGTTRGRRDRFERWTALYEAAAPVDAAPILPRPVAYLGEVNMMVCESVRGHRVDQLVANGDGAHLMRRVGAALGTLHTLPVDLGEAPPSDSGSRDLDDTLAALSSASAPVGTSLVPVVAALRAWATNLPARRAPIVTGLHLGHLVERNGRIAVRRAANVTMGYPLIAFGDFLAGVMLTIAPSGSAARRRLLDACVEGYIGATGDGHAGADELVAFGLLRYLDSRLRRHRLDEAVWPPVAAALAEISGFRTPSSTATLEQGSEHD